jgi:hypothetical protein
MSSWIRPLTGGQVGENRKAPHKLMSRVSPSPWKRLPSLPFQEKIAGARTRYRSFLRSSMGSQATWRLSGRPHSCKKPDVSQLQETFGRCQKENIPSAARRTSVIAYLSQRLAPMMTKGFSSRADKCPQNGGRIPANTLPSASEEISA